MLLASHLKQETSRCRLGPEQSRRVSAAFGGKQALVLQAPAVFHERRPKESGAVGRSAFACGTPRGVVRPRRSHARLLSPAAILDIPVYKSRVQPLHVLFSLYSEFKNSQVSVSKQAPLPRLEVLQSCSPYVWLCCGCLQRAGGLR